MAEANKWDTTGGDPGTCRAKECQRAIVWVKTPAGKRMPLDLDGTPHWATCPAAPKFKRPKR